MRALLLFFTPNQLHRLNCCRLITCTYGRPPSLSKLPSPFRLRSFPFSLSVNRRGLTFPIQINAVVAPSIFSATGQWNCYTTVCMFACYLSCKNILYHSTLFDLRASAETLILLTLLGSIPKPGKRRTSILSKCVLADEILCTKLPVDFTSLGQMKSIAH